MSTWGTIDMRLRPLKIAFAVDAHDAGQLIEAIRINTYLWGGMFNPIIPVYKRMPTNWGYLMAKRPILAKFSGGYLDAYDPDFLVSMGGTLPPYLQNAGVKVVSKDEIVDWAFHAGEPKALYGVGIDALLEDLLEKEFKYLRKYPLRVVIPQLPQKHNLFLTSLYGEYDPAAHSAIQRHYKNPLGIEEFDFRPEMFMELFQENVLFPRRITMRGIESNQRSRLRRSAYLLVMDANKVADIIDFWNLRALGREVFPMPVQFFENEFLRQAAKGFLLSNRRIGRPDFLAFDGVTIVKSARVSIADMKQFITLLPLQFADRVSQDSGKKYPVQAVFPRIWDEWARDRDGVLCDDFYSTDDSLQLSDMRDDRILLKPLMVSFANTYGVSGNPMYANELDFRSSGSPKFLAECLPKETGFHLLNSIGYDGFNRGDWRIGRNGVVSYISGPQTKLWEMPQAEKVFFAWLKDRGWEAVLSAPGILAKEIFRRLDSNVNAFKYPGFIELLEHINGGKLLKQSQAAVSDQALSERNMTVGEVKNRLTNIFSDEKIYEYLATRGVFQLGVRIKCPICSRNSWFPIREIAAVFHCPRCLNAFDAIGNVESGKWSVKTEGPFSIGNYGEGAYSVLLAHSFLEGLSLSALSLTTVLSFTATAPDGRTTEADLACFWRERFMDDSMDGLLFAECKSFGEFEKDDFKKMDLLAKNFPGAILMFATLRDKISNREINSLRRIARSGRRYWKDDRPLNPVLILTNRELRGLISVPECWEEEFAKKFRRSYGILNLCDATQQIYLGLPPIEEYWQTSFEKKKKRRRK